MTADCSAKPVARQWLQRWTVTFNSTEESVDFILTTLNDEALRVGAELKVERKERKNVSNELMISLNRSGQTFRITLNWVRDEHLDRASFSLGNGYIETQWRLLLEPEKKVAPVAPPFHWKLKQVDRSIGEASHPHILDEVWLRRLLQRKLALPQES